ncbi:174_t:CDS:10 [Paraglomus occultum]|uniref:174_t:CDS:1 n=1 Tax=Paraglomus occultum TaxID=144539 RepID=A0A9N8ZRR7_9GLOM|nr:174_t:CDS:10 [Paraglomus occultum]
MDKAEDEEINQNRPLSNEGDDNSNPPTDGNDNVNDKQSKSVNQSAKTADTVATNPTNFTDELSNKDDALTHQSSTSPFTTLSLTERRRKVQPPSMQTSKLPHNTLGKNSQRSETRQESDSLPYMVRERANSTPNLELAFPSSPPSTRGQFTPKLSSPLASRHPISASPELSEDSDMDERGNENRGLLTHNKPSITNQDHDYPLRDDKPSLLSGPFHVAMSKLWNNEFDEAEAILSMGKDDIPRWSATFLEAQLMKHVLSGQISDSDNPSLTNALILAEKVASRVNEGKDDFELSFSSFKSITRKYCLPSSSEDLPPSSRTNYRWDCDLALADILLFRAVFQVIGGSEIKGAFNLRKSWKLYSKVRDEIEKVKSEQGKTDGSSTSGNSRWSIGAPFGGRRGSFSSLVGFGLKSQVQNNQQDASVEGGTSGEVDKDVEDCLEFGIGLFYFVVSIVPGSFLSVLKAIGFNADREQGIKMLENCWKRCGIRAPFAALFLLVNYLFLPRGLVNPKPTLTRAGEIVEKALQKYPDTRFREAIDAISRGIKSCEKSNVNPTNFFFELGMTHIILLDLNNAKNILETLFYGNTTLYTGKYGSIRLHGSVRGSKRLDGTMRDKTEQQFQDFELRPFCGLCLAACYSIARPGEVGERVALDMLSQIHEMTSPPENNSSSVAGSIGLLGASASAFGFAGGLGNEKEKKASRYNKFATRHATRGINTNYVTPFLLFIILYLRRDLIYLPKDILERWSALLETTWANAKKPVDTDTNAVYLFFRGVFEKSLNPDSSVALSTFRECLSMEIGVVSETWVIPHCRYELAELLYKSRGSKEEAMEHFKWIIKGPRPISRGPALIRRDSSLSLQSLTSRSSDASASPASNTNYNPEKFKKYEFARTLKHRCTVALDQIRNGIVSPPGINPAGDQTISVEMPSNGSSAAVSGQLSNTLVNAYKSKPESESEDLDEGIVIGKTLSMKRRHKPSKSFSFVNRRESADGNSSDASSESKGKKKLAGFRFR